MVNKINHRIAYLSSGEFGSLILPELKKIVKNLTIITLASDNETNKIAKLLKLKTLKVKNKKELEKLILKNDFDYLIVADFGIILSSLTLEKVNKVINIHPSLLPKYRGPSPIISAILNKERETGVSLVKLVKEVDAGPVYAQEKIKINPKDNQTILTKKLAKLSIKMLNNNLSKIINDQITPQKQNHSIATFTKMIKKADGFINWQNKASDIEAQIRAFNKWPQAYAYLVINSKKIRVKIIKARILPSPKKMETGQTLEKKGFFAIKTRDKLISIEKLQKDGKKEMNIKEFLAGHKNIKINSL